MAPSNYFFLPLHRPVVACRYLSLPEQTRARHVKDKSNAAYILGWSERRVSVGNPLHLPAAFELLSSEPDFQEASLGPTAFASANDSHSFAWMVHGHGSSYSSPYVRNIVISMRLTFQNQQYFHLNLYAVSYAHAPV